jgi:hypothetical protein
MTALRLAEHVEHTTDVDGMLDNMTPGQFAEWCAKDLVEPIGHDTQMLSLIAFMLANYMGVEDMKPEHYMPWVKYVPINKVDNSQARNVIAAILGQPKHGKSGNVGS